MEDENTDLKGKIFSDTHMAESKDDEFADTSSKILALSDALSEDIILDDLREQLSSELDTFNDRINYVSLFREKYGKITPEDNYYDEEYMKESLGKVAIAVGQGLKDRFGVELGEDLDYTTPDLYLMDMETLYEFLFMRQYENIVSYFTHMIHEHRSDYIKAYKPKMEEETNSKDLFVVQSKKKFKDNDDVLIMHFLSEIIDSISANTDSAYTLFQEIANLDIFEEYNNRMSELITNYGNKLVLNNDTESAKKYLSPLSNPTAYSEIRNSILMEYIEGCELEDE